MYQYKKRKIAYRYIIGLKKIFTGKLLPALDIEVQPSKKGIQDSTKLSCTDAMYEIITVEIGKMKQISAKTLKFVHIDFINDKIIFSYSFF